MTRDSATPGTVAAAVLTDAGATYVTSGVLVTDAVNLQIAGASVICEILSVDSETQITLTTSPGDGSYNYRIGGARASIQKVVNSGAGNNARITANDTVGIKGGTYTENVVTNSASIYIYSSDDVEWVIDGTGGGAGSDAFTPAGGSVSGGAFINAVDDGAVPSATTYFSRCRFQANGGDGQQMGNVATLDRYCQFLANAGMGINAAGNQPVMADYCRFDGNTSHGVSLAACSGAQIVDSCTVVDNGGDGIRGGAGLGSILSITLCTIDGNASDGVEFTATNSVPSLGMRFTNNIVSNNTVGVNCSGGAQTTPYNTDYNTFYGNGTPRTNFNTGTNDIATDPVFTNAGSDDYTIASTSGSYLTAYSAYGGNNKLNRGAVQGVGSAQVVGGHPAAGDVRAGVSYANGTLTGTLIAGGAHRR